MSAPGTCAIPRGRRSRRQWQDLVDLSHAWLALDAARQYGLIEGGPPIINQNRCLELLRAGEKRGYRPSPDAIQKFVAALAEPEGQG
jgi:hypothetical protein